jgi:hypothetical protein
MKADENTEKVMSLVRENRSSFRYHNDSGGVEYGRRNGVSNFNMRKACDKWSQGIHQFLATKHIPTLEHALY